MQREEEKLKEKRFFVFQLFFSFSSAFPFPHLFSAFLKKIFTIPRIEEKKLFFFQRTPSFFLSSVHLSRSVADVFNCEFLKIGIILI